jgi:hypothetical protein
MARTLAIEILVVAAFWAVVEWLFHRACSRTTRWDLRVAVFLKSHFGFEPSEAERRVNRLLIPWALRFFCVFVLVFRYFSGRIENHVFPICFVIVAPCAMWLHKMMVKRYDTREKSEDRGDDEHLRI